MVCHEQFQGEVGETEVDPEGMTVSLTSLGFDGLHIGAVIEAHGQGEL